MLAVLALRREQYSESMGLVNDFPWFSSPLLWLPSVYFSQTAWFVIGKQFASLFY